MYMHLLYSTEFKPVAEQMHQEAKKWNNFMNWIVSHYSQYVILPGLIYLV